MGWRADPRPRRKDSEWPQPDPGWLPDPREKAVWRWWDGRRWTNATSDAETPPPLHGGGKEDPPPEDR